MYHTPCKVEYQPFHRLNSRLTCCNNFTKSARVLVFIYARLNRRFRPITDSFVGDGQLVIIHHFRRSHNTWWRSRDNQRTYLASRSLLALTTRDEPLRTSRSTLKPRRQAQHQAISKGASLYYYLSAGVSDTFRFPAQCKTPNQYNNQTDRP